MTPSRSPLAATAEFEDIARQAGHQALADAFKRCRGERDRLAILAIEPPSATARSLVPEAVAIDARAFEAQDDRVLRATRLVLIVAADKLLSAAMLEIIDSVLHSRPRKSVAVIVDGVEKVGLAGLPALETRAWKTLVADAPGNPARASLASYGVFMTGHAAEEELSQRVRKDQDLLRRWLDAPTADADILDRLALQVLATRLLERLGPGIDNPRQAPAAAGTSNAVTSSEQQQILTVVRTRIDRAFDEIERTTNTEARLLFHDAFDAVEKSLSTRDPVQTLTALLAEANERFERAFRRVVGPVLVDLNEAIEDDLTELADQTSPAAIAREFRRLADFDRLIEHIGTLRHYPVDLNSAKAPRPGIGLRTFVAGGAGAVAGGAISELAIVQTVFTAGLSSIALGPAVIAYLSAIPAALLFGVVGAAVGGAVGGATERTMRRRRRTAAWKRELSPAIERAIKRGVNALRQGLIDERDRVQRVFREVFEQSTSFAGTPSTVAPGKTAALRSRALKAIAELTAVE